MRALRKPIFQLVEINGFPDGSSFTDKVLFEDEEYSKVERIALSSDYEGEELQIKKVYKKKEKQDEL